MKKVLSVFIVIFFSLSSGFSETKDEKVEHLIQKINFIQDMTNNFNVASGFNLVINNFKGKINVRNSDFDSIETAFNKIDFTLTFMGQLRTNFKTDYNGDHINKLIRYYDSVTYKKEAETLKRYKDLTLNEIPSDYDIKTISKARQDMIRVITGGSSQKELLPVQNIFFITVNDVLALYTDDMDKEVIKKSIDEMRAPMNGTDEEFEKKYFTVDCFKYREFNDSEIRSLYKYYVSKEFGWEKKNILKSLEGALTQYSAEVMDVLKKTGRSNKK